MHRGVRNVEATIIWPAVAMALVRRLRVRPELADLVVGDPEQQGYRVFRSGDGVASGGVDDGDCAR